MRTGSVRCSDGLAVRAVNAVPRWEDKEGNLWLNLKDPQTGTLFRRRASQFT
jgi:hypothetical protein